MRQWETSIRARRNPIGADQAAEEWAGDVADSVALAHALPA